ncbi:MAG: glycosyltransferase [Thermoplasmata archaeon]
MDKKLIYVNSYTGSGIGDFGRHIYDGLSKKVLDIKYVNTGEEWNDLYRVWKTILFSRDIVIFNIGFTSFGKSAIRNFLNFLMIFFRKKILRRNNIIILHDSPDIINKNVSGYKLFFIMKLGGKIATRMMGGSHIIVFSEELKNILNFKYNVKNVDFYPLPCITDFKPMFNIKSDNIKIINIGYIAPYKGLEILPDIKKEVEKSDIKNIEFIVIGKPHKVLYNTDNGKEQIDILISMLKKSGINVPGYVPTQEVDNILKKDMCIALLPYKLVYGSSSSAIFFIERGIPVITTNQKGFIKFKELGAGLITFNTAHDLVEILRRLIVNKNEAMKLSNQNAEYCKKYNMNNFINRLMELMQT